MDAAKSADSSGRFALSSGSLCTYLFAIDLLMEEKSQHFFRSFVMSSPQLFILFAYPSLTDKVPGEGPRLSESSRIARLFPVRAVLEDANASGPGSPPIFPGRLRPSGSPVSLFRLPHTGIVS